jgi:hypothetical protein
VGGMQRIERLELHRQRDLRDGWPLEHWMTKGSHGLAIQRLRVLAGVIHRRFPRRLRPCRIDSTLAI